MWTPTFLFRFFSKDARTRAFIKLVERGGFTLARKLLKSGINANDSLSAVLLHGPADLIAPLLKAGANVNTRHPDHNALLLASQSTIDRKRKLKMVVNAGANVNASVAPSQRTLLTFSVLERDETFAHFLVRHGADLNQADLHGLTPLKLARMTGQTELAAFFTESGARSQTITCSDVEKTFLRARPLWWQLHQTLKASLTANGFALKTLELEWPAEELILLYNFKTSSSSETRAPSFTLRVEIFLNETISLTLIAPGAQLKSRDLSPLYLNSDGAALQTYANTKLSELRSCLQSRQNA